MTRLAEVLADPDSENDADELIEAFGDVEANRLAVAEQLKALLAVDTLG